MFRRVANNIAQAEAKYGSQEDVAAVEVEFYNLMISKEFMPNSPTLMNAGRDLQQLSACFVLPVEDSMESIFSTIHDTAMIHKSGGGTGFSFSQLRPANSRVKSTNGVSSGPISFMRVFDAATEAIKQGGTRRGANMGILRIDHPDIEEFITCKADNDGLTNFNISVALTEKFMDALENGNDYDIINPHTGEITGKKNAKDIFGKVVSSAWQNGDPGIIFLDRLNADNPTPKVGEIESTNPCGEQPLLSYESCNLGSINLALMLDDDGFVDWERLKGVVHTAVHFLDNVIDMNQYPLDKIDQMTKGNRKIGLGIMGWADLLIKLGIPYNSEEALALASEIMEFVDMESKQASRELANYRGEFPNFEGSNFDRPGSAKLRNATTTTIAPTGTISIISGCSSGIEPLFALSYIRTVMDNDKLVEVHPLFEEAAKNKGNYSKELMEKVAFEGHVEDIEEIDEEMKSIFVTAHGVSPEWHVKMQAAFQKHTDNAVSKTVNFPSSATESDVSDVYLKAYDFGCKGVTIYRDGSRDDQVLSTGSTYGKENVDVEADGKGESHESKIVPRPRPDMVFGSTQRINTGCGSIYVTVNHDETGKPFELFTQIGKAGGCAASQTESIGRLVSLALRAGIDVDEIRSQLMGISCHQPAWEKGVRISSCADAISKSLAKLAQIQLTDNGSNENGAEVQGGFIPLPIQQVPVQAVVESSKDISPVGACPDCGGALAHENGCLLCHSCGYSKC